MKLNLMSLTAALAVTLAFAQTAHARDHKQGRGVYHVAGNGGFGDRNHGQPFSYGANDAFAGNTQGAYQGRDVRRAQNTYRVRGTYREQHAYRAQSADRPERTYQTRTAYQTRRTRQEPLNPYQAQFAQQAQSSYQGGLGGRPRAWCGWHMRQVVGGDPGPQFNLARNWAHWGRPGPAGIGAVVVWSHHVGKIVGQENGQWIVESGNDGNRVRARPLPISNAIAIRWG